MNRRPRTGRSVTISATLALMLSTLVQAAPLYKWIEADGTITFSPDKPPAGISYEKVTGSLSESVMKSAEPAKSATSQPAASPAVQQKAASTSKPATSAVTYAPAQSDSPDTVRGISAGTAVANQPQPALGAASGEASETVDAASSNSGSDQNSAIAADSSKKRHCEDLKKRVVSLERRLGSRLSPQDMDNTVVHMARYQQSFDQHCSGW